MAWNEPGKDKKREPWQDGEPPDFDAALKQIKDRLAQFFGGGGGSGLTIAIAVIVALLLVVAPGARARQRGFNHGALFVQHRRVGVL